MTCFDLSGWLGFSYIGTFLYKILSFSLLLLFEREWTWNLARYIATCQILEVFCICFYTYILNVYLKDSTVEYKYSKFVPLAPTA